MMRHFLGCMDLWKMILLVVFVVVFAGKATGEEELIEELSSREEVVNWAGYGEDKLSTVVIDGKLLCHASFNHKLPPHPFPIAGSLSLSLDRYVVVKFFVLQ